MGVRGLCNGLGPAAFGIMFYLFGINIVEPVGSVNPASNQTFETVVLANMTWKVTLIIIYYNMCPGLRLCSIFETITHLRQVLRQDLNNTFALYM